MPGSFVLLAVTHAVLLRQPGGLSTSSLQASTAVTRRQDPLLFNASNGNGTNGTNVTPTYLNCYSQYQFADCVLGDLTTPITIDYRLMNLTHMEAEVRYCVDMNPKFNGDLFLECVDGELRVENATCYPDLYPPVMWDMHFGEFVPDDSFNINDTQLMNLTAENPQQVAPWDQIILRFNEVVQAGHGDISITELNPPSVRRDYLGDVISIPAEDYFQLFLGEGSQGEGIAVIKSKKGHLPTKDGGQHYKVDIPEGVLLDRAGNNAIFTALEYNSSTVMVNNLTGLVISQGTTSLSLEFIASDIRAPSIVPDWVQAFWPMHGDQGRYENHNISITLDEPVFKRGPLDATVRLEPRYSDDVQCYNEFQIHGCGPVYLDEGHAIIEFNLYDPRVVLTDGEEGAGRTLNIYPGGLELGVTYAVVIADDSLSDASGLNFTGLGTLKQGNYYFTVATSQQMELRNEIIFLADYTERRLNDTMEMFGVASANDMPWVDSFAKLRVLTLVWAISESRKILADPHGLPVVLDLQSVRNELFKDRIEPHGEPFSKPWVCPDLQTHMLESVGFECQPAVQKSGIGFDIITRTGTFAYKDGCMCVSHFMGNCPFNLQASTSYKQFGFVAMDEKVISPGYALCWYWSNPSNPEHGYISSPSNYFNTTFPDDDRLKKQLWSWDAAHRPTEGALRDPERDHHGIPQVWEEEAAQSLLPVAKERKEVARSQEVTRALPESAKKLHLRRASHVPKRPAVPRVDTPKIVDAIARVLPRNLPPAEPQAAPTRYPPAPDPSQLDMPTFAPAKVATPGSVYDVPDWQKALTVGGMAPLEYAKAQATPSPVITVPPAVINSNVWYG